MLNKSARGLDNLTVCEFLVIVAIRSKLAQISLGLSGASPYTQASLLSAEEQTLQIRASTSAFDPGCSLIPGQGSSSP